MGKHLNMKEILMRKGSLLEMVNLFKGKQEYILVILKMEKNMEKEYLPTNQVLVMKEDIMRIRKKEKEYYTIRIMS